MSDFCRKAASFNKALVRMLTTLRFVRTAQLGRYMQKRHRE